MKQKLKSRRGAMKRFKVTGTGKVRAAKSHKRHILAPKPHKRKRQARKGLTLNKTEAKIVKRMLLQ
jgi:large subunit ribosomal protein L35